MCGKVTYCNFTKLCLFMLTFTFLALQDDPELMGIVKIVDELTAQSSNTSIIQVLPFLRHVAPELTRYAQLS